jgi:hypothetical protein
LQGVWSFAEAQARRLLRVLLLRVGQMPADPATEVLLLRIGKTTEIWRIIRKILVFERAQIVLKIGFLIC